MANPPEHLISQVSKIQHQQPHLLGGPQTTPLNLRWIDQQLSTVLIVESWHGIVNVPSVASDHVQGYFF